MPSHPRVLQFVDSWECPFVENSDTNAMRSTFDPRSQCRRGLGPLLIPEWVGCKVFHQLVIDDTNFDVGSI